MWELIYIQMTFRCGNFSFAIIRFTLSVKVRICFWVQVISVL
jgi:hypothetical protein